MIESARSTDWTPTSRESASCSVLGLSSIALRRITFRFIATCIHPLDRLPARRSQIPFLNHWSDQNAAPGSVPKRHLFFNVSEETRAACPFVLGPEHLDRQFGRVGISRNA